MKNPRFLTHPRFVSRLLGGALASIVFSALPAGAQAFWGDYAGNAQHTALSVTASQSLNGIIWQTPVDLNPQYSGNDLLIHYGSPLVTQANTVLLPVKIGATDGFMVKALSGSDGTVRWTFTSDYTLPTHDWTPSYSPTLTPTGRLYMAGAGGTVYYKDNVDSLSPSGATQVAFFGTSQYNANKAAYNAAVQICTPLTSDAQGNVYFGYRVNGATPNGLVSGFARIGADGSTTFVSASTATGGGATQVVLNCAPALSNDGATVYVGMSDVGQTGYLVALNSTTLATTSKVRLKDPVSGSDSFLPDNGTASPTVAPDGTVYYGVLEDPFNSSKGWMLHFSADLSQTKTPGAFGWDDTASIVPASMVPSYNGGSSYLVMTKYNNYAELGGDGVNKIAILDPNSTQTDARTGATVMKEIETIAGPTPDLQFIQGHPNAVREWCINTAVVDPFTDSVLANSEDGKLYRWNLASNSFTQQITLTQGVGEAYTPTIIAHDGKVFAINNATLFAVGATPEPGAWAWLLTGGAVGLCLHARRRRGTHTRLKSCR
jgi:hypothetical protein